MNQPAVVADAVQNFQLVLNLFVVQADSVAEDLMAWQNLMGDLQAAGIHMLELEEWPHGLNKSEEEEVQALVHQPENLAFRTKVTLYRGFASAQNVPGQSEPCLQKAPKGGFNKEVKKLNFSF